MLELYPRRLKFLKDKFYCENIILTHYFPVFNTCLSRSILLFCRVYYLLRYYSSIHEGACNIPKY